MSNRSGSTISVLLIAPSLDILGGQAVQATRLIKCLGTQDGLRMAFQPINPRIGFLRKIKGVRTIATFSLYVASLLLRAWRYDILHVFSASYYSYSLWTLPALFFAKIFRKKIILNYRDGQAEDHLKNWRTALPTIRMMDRVVTPSGFLVDVFARFGIDAKRIFNIIYMDQFHWRERRKLRPVFLHNRILEPLYNIECSLRAFRIVQNRYPEATLTVAHDGPLRASLEIFAHSLKLQNTVFVGRVPHDQIASLYDSVDLYITSPDFDCMPGSLLECFASGLPVVATAAGGIPYIVENERTALLVPCNSPEAMANAAFRLLEHEDLVTYLTANAYEECKRYSPVVIRSEWAKLYRELVP